MSTNNIKKIIVLCILFIALTIVVICNKKTDLKNQIAITIIAIDKYTKQPRVKAYDTIEVRMGKPAFPMREYINKGKYITNSLGLIEIKIDKTERYRFNLYGSHVFSFTEFAEDELKNGQQVIIEVVPPEKRMIPR